MVLPVYMALWYCQPFSQLLRPGTRIFGEFRRPPGETCGAQLGCRLKSSKFFLRTLTARVLVRLVEFTRLNVGRASVGGVCLGYYRSDSHQHF